MPAKTYPYHSQDFNGYIIVDISKLAELRNRTLYIENYTPENFLTLSYNSCYISTNRKIASMSSPEREELREPAEPPSSLLQTPTGFPVARLHSESDYAATQKATRQILISFMK